MKFSRGSERPDARRAISEGRVRDIVDEVVRSAVREQARDLETHLSDIHTRLVKLETQISKKQSG